MKADEIMQVLRMTAMSRINTPIQEEFCQKLEELFAGWVAPTAVLRRAMEDGAEVFVADGVEVVSAPKRGPGRPKKAE